MPFDAGRAYVDVLPATSGFASTLQRDLSKSSGRFRSLGHVPLLQRVARYCPTELRLP